MRLVLFGDGESPHLVKWARALAPRVDLWVASSRAFAPGFDDCAPVARRLALHTRPAFAGGNVAVLRTLPRLARWLKQVQPDWINPHYLTSHGSLAWLATSTFGAPGRLVGSAWGSDILQTPERSRGARALTRRVLAACEFTTSDSRHMAERMKALGAREVMTFPFGLEVIPPQPQPGDKDPHLFFANRALEPIYAPMQVLAMFSTIASAQPEARLVLANDGSLRDALAAEVARLGLAERVQMVGRLDAQAQARCYTQAQWFISVPSSDSVSVSVLEAMAHGCVPILSDLPANRELVRHGDNGLIVPVGPADGQSLIAALEALRMQADRIAARNHAWAREHAFFPDAIERFVTRLHTLGGPR